MRTASLLAPLTIAATGAIATGCAGPSCQSSCNRIYQESQCNIQSAGTTREDLLSRCLDECESALDIEGDIGDYNPNEYTPANESVTLNNDRQAALWMDCVEVTDCKLLNEGYCAPIW